jgi:hypothetical protein
MERFVSCFFEIEGGERQGQQINDTGGCKFRLLQGVPGLTKADHDTAEVRGLDMLRERDHIVGITGGAITFVPTAQVQQDYFRVEAFERRDQVSGGRDGGFGDDQVKLVGFGYQLINDVSGVGIGGIKGEAQHS